MIFFLNLRYVSQCLLWFKRSINYPARYQRNECFTFLLCSLRQMMLRERILRHLWHTNSQFAISSGSRYSKIMTRTSSGSWLRLERSSFLDRVEALKATLHKSDSMSMTLIDQINKKKIKKIHLIESMSTKHVNLFCFCYTQNNECAF